MPIYVLKCLSCGTVQEKILGLSEIDGMDAAEMDLRGLGEACNKCGESLFEKQIAAHGKTSHNWSGWQRNEK